MFGKDTDNEFGFNDDLITGYKVKVEAKGLDYKGRELTTNKSFDSVELAAAYLKLINVPCMFDMGVTACNPCDQQLNLNMIDDQTFKNIIVDDIIKGDKPPKMKKIERLKTAIESLHLNLYVSEVIITVHGYVVEQGKERMEIDNMTRALLE